MNRDNTISCPFCTETDFDRVGLKHHLLSGGCEIFNATITIEQERQLTNQSTVRGEPCPKGGDHEWGIDGVHSNKFCKKCYGSRDKKNKNQ